MKNKKGAELSVNVIIVAVIALLVLVVLSVVFMDQIRVFVDSISGKCSGKGGTCLTSCSLDLYNPQPNLRGCTGGTTCCVPK